MRANTVIRQSDHCIKSSIALTFHHYGGNTHFRQICFAVPNFNFIYIYKIKNYLTTHVFFKK